MTKITVDTFWNPENDKTTARWIALTMAMLAKTDDSPTTNDVMDELGIDDEALARYVLNYSRDVITALRKWGYELKPSS